MMSAVNGTTVSHIAVLDAGVTDIDVGFNLVMSQGIAVTIRAGSGRCDPVSCDRRCVVGSLHERLRIFDTLATDIYDWLHTTRNNRSG